MLQPPYTVAAMADHAGTGQHAPPPVEEPTCASCGTVIATGRIYCSDRACIRKHNTMGRTTERRFEPFPNIGTYNA